MKRMIYMICIAILGFILNPSLTYACGKSSNQTTTTCCSTTSSSADHKDCCKKNHSSKEDKEKGCKGGCANSSCHCQPSVSLLSTFSDVETEDVVLSFIEKPAIFYKKVYLLQGYFSIWQPPKIS